MQVWVMLMIKETYIWPNSLLLFIWFFYTTADLQFPLELRVYEKQVTAASAIHDDATSIWDGIK